MNNSAKQLPSRIGNTIRLSGPSFRFFAIFCIAAAALIGPPALAQSGPSKSAQQKPAANGKEAQKRINEIAKARRLLVGPAGNPECVWLGRRVVALLWRDDMDTAFRHLDLYDRFGCPSAHIQAAFRCLVRQGPFDPKAADTLNSRVFSCWIDPTMKPQPAAAVSASTPVGAPAPLSRGGAGATKPH